MTTSTIKSYAPSGRAVTVEAFQVLMGSLTTPEGVQTGLNLQLRPTDIVISPYGKCGTTWLQQMCHTLRTRGDMDYEDISAVAPWIETSTDLGLDLDAEQKANPRLFKSHLSANHVPKGGRYINSCRDPRDAIYSMYKFMEGWLIEPGSLSLDDFARGRYIAPNVASANPRGGYWAHLKSWWLRRNDPDVLFMAFEHMKRDLTSTVNKVAAFMNIDLDDELLAITLEHASLPFMQQHKNHFDDKLMRERSTVAAGVPADSDSAKVRSGQVGEAQKQFSTEVMEELDEIWQQQITSELGFESYAQMIASLR